MAGPVRGVVAVGRTMWWLPLLSPLSLMSHHPCHHHCSLCLSRAGALGGFRQEGAQALEAKAHAEVQSLEVCGLWRSGIQRRQDTQEGQDLGRVW